MKYAASVFSFALPVFSSNGFSLYPRCTGGGWILQYYCINKAHQRQDQGEGHPKLAGRLTQFQAFHHMHVRRAASSFSVFSILEEHISDQSWYSKPEPCVFSVVSSHQLPDGYMHISESERLFFIWNTPVVSIMPVTGMHFFLSCCRIYFPESPLWFSGKIDSDKSRVTILSHCKLLFSTKIHSPSWHSYSRWLLRATRLLLILQFAQNKKWVKFPCSSNAQSNLYEISSIWMSASCFTGKAHSCTRHLLVPYSKLFFKFYICMLQHIHVTPLSFLRVKPSCHPYLGLSSLSAVRLPSQCIEFLY